MNFAQVATAFEAIEHISSRTEITQLLADLFKKSDPEEVEIICNLALGQLHPIYITTLFNMAEKSLIEVVARIIQHDVAAVKEQLHVLGDLGNVLMRHSWKVEKQLSIKNVYEWLCSLEKIEGRGSQELKSEHVQELIRSVDPLSAKYIVRIILGKLRLGFSDMTIIDALSWMEVGNKSLHAVIEEAYNICADLGLIAREIKHDGVEALKKQIIHIGIPIRPAAAERLPTAKEIIEKIGPCVAQPKLDGFRLQIHVDRTAQKSRVHFFSRHLQDMSSMFPDLIDLFAHLPVKTVICEGEAIGYNSETGDFLPFQETAKRRRKYEIEKTAAAFPLRVFLFDLLYLNGKNMMSLPHEKRRQELLTIGSHIKNDAIVVVPEYKMNTAQQLEEFFLSEVAAGLEGLVVKKPDAPYLAGKRNFNWIKLKRRQQGHLEDTIDCVILGYYQGAGKRAQFGIGAFLVGVYNKKEDCFQTIAKVGTGLKDDEWRMLKKKCDEQIVDHKPRNVECVKQLEPDVWINPSIVCMILADEITLSPVHTAGKTEKNVGYALRFPRFVGYREDKGAQEATEVQEIKRLYDDQFKLSS